MTTENNPGQLFTAVDVDFTNITKHRDISQMNRSKPFQQFDPEKTSFLFRNLLYCKDKDANVVIKWESQRLVPSKFSIITSHIPYSTCLSHIPALYYGVSICLVTFASAMAVVTLNIHHMGLRGKDVSSIILSIFTSVSTYIDHKLINLDHKLIINSISTNIQLKNIRISPQIQWPLITLYLIVTTIPTSHGW